MDPFVAGIAGVVVLLLLLGAGVYIGVAIGIVGTLGLIILIGKEAAVTTAATSAFHFAVNPHLVVIPTFTLMGLAASYGGISEATFKTLRKLTSRLPGGLAIAAVGGCTAFGAVTGSSVVTATVFAKVSCPQMRQLGYNKRFSYGIVSTAGMIGMLIPPSMYAVYYGIITEESIGQLLLAGIGPGLLLAVIYSVGIVVMVMLRPSLAPSTGSHSSLREVAAGIRDLWPLLISALVIIGGIYGGVFTPTEAAAWGALVVLIISFLWGHMGLKQLWAILSETVGIMAMVFLLITTAQIFTKFMAVSGVADALLESVIGANPSTWQLLLGMMIIYLILGCFLDSISMLVLTMPFIYPVVKMMEIDPMWFAMVCIMSIETGLITPPVGMNVYGVKSVAEADVTVEDIFIGVIPFLCMTILGICIVLAFPPIANWLPRHMN